MVKKRNVFDTTSIHLFSCFFLCQIKEKRRFISFRSLSFFQIVIFSHSVMSQNSSGKKTLLHSTENHPCPSQGSKNHHRSTSKNENGKKLDENSEFYWKTLTEQRRRAIEETKVENQQVKHIDRLTNSSLHSLDLVTRFNRRFEQRK